MGQKCIRTDSGSASTRRRSRWFADKDYSKLLHEDLKLRDTLKTRSRTPVSRRLRSSAPPTS